MTSTHVMQLLYQVVQHTSHNYYSLISHSGYDVYASHEITILHCSYTRHTITASYYNSLIRTSTHVMHLHYHTVQTHIIQLLLLTTSQWPGRLHKSCIYNITLFRHTSFNDYFLLYLSYQDVYTRHVFTISHCSDLCNSITTSYYISVIRTSTPVMHL